MASAPKLAAASARSAAPRERAAGAVASARLSAPASAGLGPEASEGFDAAPYDGRVSLILSTRGRPTGRVFVSVDANSLRVTWLGKRHTAARER